MKTKTITFTIDEIRIIRRALYKERTYFGSFIENTKTRIKNGENGLEALLLRGQDLYEQTETSYQKIIRTPIS